MKDILIMICKLKITTNILCIDTPLLWRRGLEISNAFESYPGGSLFYQKAYLCQISLSKRDRLCIFINPFNMTEQKMNPTLDQSSLRPTRTGSDIRLPEHLSTSRQWIQDYGWLTRTVDSLGILEKQNKTIQCFKIIELLNH